jgi:hypothetical protein
MRAARSFSPNRVVTMRSMMRRLGTRKTCAWKMADRHAKGD